MNKNLIEKLKYKTYVRAFGLMSPEEQECFEKVGKENCLYYACKDAWDQADSLELHDESTYVIKSDYQPEPEYVDLEIKTDMDDHFIEWLGVYDDDSPFEMPHFFTHLHCLPSLPNFEGFWCNNGIPVSLVHVAAKKTVYARFRSKP